MRPCACACSYGLPVPPVADYVQRVRELPGVKAWIDGRWPSRFPGI